jgi:hypothetical protein
MPRPKKQVDPIDTVLKLKVEDLMRKRTLDAEIKSAQAQVTVLTMKIAEYIRSNPEFRNLLELKDEATKEISKRAGELTSLHKEIEERYKIKLSDCAFDDETGVIQILKKEEPPKVSEEPTPALKRGRKRSI